MADYLSLAVTPNHVFWIGTIVGLLALLSVWSLNRLRRLEHLLVGLLQ